MRKNSISTRRICNFGGLFVRQFVVPSFPYSLGYNKSMNTVFIGINPFKIFSPIIRFVAINMVDKWLVKGVGNECFSNHSVNCSFLANVYVNITAFVKVKVQKLSLYNSFVSSKLNFMVKTSDVSKVADLVLVFVANNIFPNFHKVGFCKDKTLSISIKTKFA